MTSLASRAFLASQWRDRCSWNGKAEDREHCSRIFFAGASAFGSADLRDFRLRIGHGRYRQAVGPGAFALKKARRAKDRGMPAAT